MEVRITSPDIPTRQLSLSDRLKAAYYAFRQQHAPDTVKLLEMLNEIRKEGQEHEKVLGDKREQALAKLDAFDRASVDSILGRTDNWHLLFDHVMTVIEPLDTADQITIVRHMFSENRHIVRQRSFRDWVARHADALLDSMPEE